MRCIMAICQVAFSVMCIAAAAVHAQDVPATALAQIRPRMQAFVDSGEIAGAVNVIGRSGGVLSIEPVGYQNLETKTPMAKDTIFRIASMTKPITAMAIMMLVDEGAISVDDPVEKHLPEFTGQMLVANRDKGAGTVTLKRPSRPITIRDLLTHTSGMGGWPAGLADIYRARNRSLAEGVLVISQQPLEFEPGSKWAYSNTGIDTLGRIVEVKSGISYEDFLRRRFFEPLMMRDTTFYPNQEQRRRMAVTYDKVDGKLVPAKQLVIDLPESGGRYPLPAAGLYSTGEDLAKLYRMVLNRGTAGNVRFLSDKSIKTMTQLQTGDLKTGFVDGMGFGFGWAVVRKPQGVTESLSPGSFGHGGVYGTQAWLDPNKDVYSVLLFQRTGLPNADASPMRRELQRLAAEAIGHK